MRRVFALLVCAAVIVSAAQRSIAGAIPQPGTPAPDFTASIIANGHGAISLSQLKGKAIYLNFFASWCVPCKAEVPWIARFSKWYARKGIVVIGIDELESASAAQRFVAQYRLPYAIGGDSSGSIGASYGLIGLPLHVFIGADGKIVARRSGEMSATEIRAGLDRIARR